MYDFQFLKIQLKLIKKRSQILLLALMVALSSVLEILAPMSVYAYLDMDVIPAALKIEQAQLLHIIAATFLAKGLVGFAVYDRIYKIAFELQRAVSTEVFFHYVNSSYTQFRKSTTGEILNDILKEPGNVTFNFTIPSLTIAFEVITVCALIILCSSISLTITLLSGILFSSFAVALLLITRSFIDQFSKTRLNEDKRKSTIASNSLNNFVMQKFSQVDQVIESFDLANANSAEAEARQQTISIIPRFALETIFIIALIFTATFSVVGESGAGVVGAFAVIGFRLIPSITRTLSSFQLFKYSHAITRQLGAILTQPKPSKSNLEVTSVDLVSVEQLTFEANGEAILDRVSLEFTRGGIYVIWGRSGSGKSTLLKHIAGLYETDCVLYDGIPVQELDATRIVSYFDQHVFVPEIPLSTYLDVNSVREIPPEAIEMMLDTGLGRLHAAVLSGIDPALGHSGLNLSGGEKQRLALVKIILEDRPIVVMDEPTSGLDSLTEIAVTSLIRKFSSNRILIIATHDEDVLKLADSVVYVDK
jgi:ABC-type bacteriocin/lantibiotic exporter with double-glycine peptidase domain